MVRYSYFYYMTILSFISYPKSAFALETVWVELLSFFFFLHHRFLFVSDVQVHNE